MRVLLRDDVNGVGKRGDIVEVAKGFARNYLFPTGRALVASPGVEAQATAMRRNRALRDAHDRESAQAVSAVLTQATVTVKARAGTEGRLFGSVTSADLAEAVEAQTGAVIDRRKIVLDEPIKTIGTHEVPVHLLADVDITLTIEVVAS